MDDNVLRLCGPKACGKLLKDDGKTLAKKYGTANRHQKSHNLWHNYQLRR